MASAALSCLLLSFLLFLQTLSLFAQNVKVGDSLTAGNKPESLWLSPSGDFAFGFRQIEKKDLYLLAIWYNKIPDKTIVWFANGDSPAPKGSKVELNFFLGLYLAGPQGAEIWKSGLRMGQAGYGLMNDTGNFVVANSEGEKLWQSFDHPTDTLLPGQTLERLDRGGQMLSSRLRANNFSLGRFQFRLIPDGNAVLNANNMPTGTPYEAYFWSLTVDSNISNAGLQVVFNESGYLYVLRANNKIQLLTKPEGVVPATDYYHRVTLNFDGVFVQYSYPKNSTANGNWSIIHTMPENICTGLSVVTGTGPCGFNGICQLGLVQRPICTCPQRFSLLDPDDKYGGCRPDFETQFCEKEVNVTNSQEGYDFLELTNTDWPNADYEMYKPYNVEDCKKACSQDCFCNVIIFRGDTCWKKKFPLSNGRQAADVNGKAFIKIRKGDYIIRGPPSLPLGPLSYPKHNQNGLVLAVSVLLGGSVLVNIIFVVVVSFGYFFSHHNKSPRIERAAESNLRYFSYKELVEVADDFKEELGRGSFGIVYKGLIKMGNTKVPVAVKKLDRLVAESEKEFKTEVNVIGQTHHKNLLQLVGFCDEGQHRLLVYEFLSNGTLANFLYGDTKLRWQQRTQIACSIARGLFYLHEECSTQIIHCDIKPQNILIDDYYDAKIADFGLAKLLFFDQSKTFTVIRGTKGYVAPEWFRNMPITVKVDVYSFGVLLLEIICCRRSVDLEMSEERAILTDWAYDCYKEGKICALVEDDDEEETLNDMKMLERFVMVAIWCIQEDPTLRPTMKIAMLMLEGIIQVPVPPCPFPFSTVS